VPEGLAYPDAVQLCLRLYCTVDGVPSELLPLARRHLGTLSPHLEESVGCKVAHSPTRFLTPLTGLV